jgi:hypothetical protein
VVSNPLVANNDTFPSTGKRDNKRYFKRVPATTANTDVTPVTNGPLSIDTDGDLTLKHAISTRTLVYEICEAGAIQ